ncbi:MAG: VOC family protein [Proteobacteria bacterium]|nr:VOC family protein [Pseudomonadota bacterium]
MKILKTLLRLYLKPDQLEDTIHFYETLFGEKNCLHFKYPELGLELAQVDSLLFIAGTDQALTAFKATQATFLVDSIEEWRAWLIRNGATVLKEPKSVPTGINMLVKHPEGTLIEYVEHHVKIDCRF